MANTKTTKNTKVKPAVKPVEAPKKTKNNAKTTKETKTVSAPVLSKTSTKTTRKVTPVKKEVAASKKTTIPAKKDGATTPISTSPIRRIRFDKKVVWPLVGLLVFAVLAYVASRYLIIAWVDKKPITRFEYYSVLDKRYGKDIREQLIVQKLVESEAQKRHVTVTQTEVNNEIKNIEQQQGGAEQLNQALQAQGIDRSDLNNLVRLQLLRDKMFGSNVNITDADIDNYIQQNKANLPQVDPNNASATAQLRDSIKNQLKQQKVSDNFNTWLQQTLNSNRVIRL